MCPERLALPPIVLHVAPSLVNELLHDGPVPPVQLLVAALLPRPLVTAQVSASTPVVLVILVTIKRDVSTNWKQVC